MKKTLLAAALLAGFAGAAQAQSNVTLYGIVDAGFNYAKLEGNKSRVGIDSGLMGQSRWGIRGSEDIGNGLKAIFTLENGFNADEGTQLQSRLFGRAAWVGLESASAGRVIFGRTTNLGFAWAAGIVNPFGLSFGTSTVGSTFGYNDADLGAGRADNAVYYFSPRFSGFQAGIGYSFNINGQETMNTKANSRLLDLGVQYANGPLKAVLTYQIVDPVSQTAGGTAVANNGKFKNLTLGANYDFGVVAVYAGYANAKNINNPGAWNGAAAYSGTGYTSGATSANFTKDNAWTLGVSAPIGGAAKVYAAYQKATQSKVKGFALGATYDLSKRTNLYAYFAQNEVRQWTTNRDLDARQFAAGLQHRF
ncbi:Outer membrane porin protein precursor [Pigmentiphaga humi]|uniref:Outer membrane porin protein n=1 Tax=Pigmentiphaga humi TaxID=2478468 RepID=A0A3P4BA29_9BURK|nr:porin [Pigmentiphaga humi]VCU71995.1 Outer membrane porin protein precursor [Pigmentiphaga humi]